MNKWSGKSEGFPLGYKIFIFVIRTFGVPPSYFLLYFVSPFYYLILSKARKNLIVFYNSIPALKGHNKYILVLKNFTTLGKTIIDKLAFLTKWRKLYSYSADGEEYLTDLIAKKQSTLLISAHIGSWNIAGEFLTKIKAKVNVVLFDGESKSLKSLLQDRVKRNTFNIISVKDDLTHLIKIKAAVDRGEFICILADRYIEGSKTIKTSFCDNMISLPKGPFEIPLIFKIPYSFVFVVKESMYSYHLSATEPKVTDKSKQIITEFTNLLISKTVKYPDQWFNYFNFIDND